MENTEMLTIISLLAVCCLTSGLPSPVGLFSVVQFPNDACSTGSGLTGTCVTSSECNTRAGTADGSCASGFGVCCLVVASECVSSLTISHNNTYVRNPSYPSALPSSTSSQSCGYKVEKLNDKICQLRLDFHTVELGQTASSGVCTDTFQVTASADTTATTLYPAICGTSTGHHMYVHLGSTSDNTAELKVTVAASATTAKWNILTRQVECNSEWTAPDGCAMWLTGITNSWSMYGYKEGQTGVEHIPNHNYNVCIRQEEGYCAIRHEVQTSTSFELSSDTNVLQTAIGYAGSTKCYNDFISIPAGSLDGNSPTHDRHCGHVLTSMTAGGTANLPIISKSVPFMVTVHTDGLDASQPATLTDTPYGVAMKYTLLPC